MRGSRSTARAFTAIVAMACLAASCGTPAPVVAENFQVESVFGAAQPTSVRFAADGRTFVAERFGKIIEYDSVNDPSPTTVIDLTSVISTMWDRGLLSIALDPGFTTGRPYLYALYSLNAPPGGTVPTYLDNCFFSGFGNNGVCGVTTGRLSRIEVGPANTSIGQVTLLTDWCQQYGSHSIADLEFGPEGALYVSSGEGASFELPDWGQLNDNPCGDPINEGGALRAQDARTTGDPTGLSGSVIRINPDTGAAWPTNPWAASPDQNRARIIAYGLRNPFRMTVDPVANKLFIGDVGWGSWEELDTVDLADPTPPNFGWPCFEGVGRQQLFDAAHVPLCDSLTAAQVKAPSFSYSPADTLAGGCNGGDESITGVAVVRNNSYPSPFNNGIYLADYARQCIVFAPRLADGTYDFGALRTVVTGAAAVDLRVGPGGNLYYVDIVTNTIQRISPTGTNHAPVAGLTASPAFGALPLHVSLDGSGSSDADAADQPQLTFHWDLDDDGQYDDGTGGVISTIFTSPGPHRVGLRVTDPHGASSVADTTVVAGNSPPVPVIDLPAPSTVAPGSVVGFTGHATDPQDGTVSPSGLHWTLLLQHCDTPLSCHVHQIGDSDGSASGQFQMPSHPSPSFLDIVLTATDSGGSSDSTSVRLTIGG